MTSDTITRILAPKMRSRTSNIFCSVGQYLNPSYGVDLNSRHNGKLVVFGLPKSGNVWLVSLLCYYLDQAPIDPVVDVDAKGIGMSHLPYSDKLASRRDFVHGVYLMRDLRDVVVSYFHHTRRDDFRSGFPNFHYDTLDHFYFQWFLPRVAPFHKIHTHAIEYGERGLPIVRYEDLWSDAEAEFSRLLLRLGFKLDPDRLRKVVAGHTLDVMRSKGATLDVAVPSSHFRKGGWGAFREEMGKNVLKDIEARFSDVLEGWGYELYSR